MLKTICLALKLCTTLSGQAIVVDGDTIIVENKYIRIAGIDAEEMTDKNGAYAKRGLLTIIGPNPVTCKVNGDRSHNRYVASCTVNGIDLATEAVRYGYALDCARYSGSKHRFYEPEGIRKTLRQAPYC
jgi:endonuclease YncB( thermonuclease family)